MMKRKNPPPKKSKAALMEEVRDLLIDRFGHGTAGAISSINYLTNFFTAWDLEAIEAELSALKKEREKRRAIVVNKKAVAE